MQKINPLLLFLVSWSFCFSQMPESDIWLFKIKTNKQNQLYLTDSINITNRKGYDNQPSFSKDEKQIYFVSVKEDKQADIFTFQIKNKKIQQLTKSKESEYSPQIIEDGKSIAVVAVEEDSAQFIHIMNATTGTFEKKMGFDSVGYYHYLNADTIIYYKLTNPHSLRMHVIKTGEDKWLCNHPIRGFKIIDRSKLLYGIKDSLKVTYYIYNFILNKGIEYATYPSNNEDAFWHPQLGLMKSEGAKIYRYLVNKKEWILYFDLTPFRIKKITRFLFDTQNKYLILVNNT